MDGCKYNCAKRLHKLVYKALMRLAWKGFLPWLKLKHAGEVHHFNKAMKSIASLQGGVSQAVSRSFLSVNPVSTSCSCIKPTCTPSEINISFQHSGCHTLTWQRLYWSCFEPPERVIGCSILHPSGRWFHGASPMTGSTIPASCLTTTPRCHDCLLSP